MWYFAYGTDLNRNAVVDWCRAFDRPVPRREVERPAVLHNYRLAFSSFDPFWDGGVADIITEPGKSVAGALIEITALGMATLEKMAQRHLDRAGREAGLRHLVKVPVAPYQGTETVEAVSFRIARPDCRHIPPTRRYMDRLIESASKLGLSSIWVMQLQSFETLAEVPGVDAFGTVLREPRVEAPWRNPDMRPPRRRPATVGV